MKHSANESGDSSGDGPLCDLHILELGSLFAGPLAGTLLADFGAEVVHVEKPGAGDPVRVAGPPTQSGVHLWWKVTMRNKRSVTLDLSDPRSHPIFMKLVDWADVVTENFRPGTLESWGLGPDVLFGKKPDLILLRISGFGQTGPQRHRPGFGKVGEAMSGVVALTGFPDTPPAHVGFSLGDTSTGLMGALGIMMALYNGGTEGKRHGELIDLALFETLFRLIEWQIPAYDALGFVGARRGNRFPFAPALIANTYATSDGHWITVSTATGRAAQLCVDLLGSDADEYRQHAEEESAADILDEAMSRWMGQRPKDDALRELHAASIVASTIYTVEDIVSDETYGSRGDIVTVPDSDLGELRQPAPIPHFRARPGKIRREAPRLGADNEYVYRDLLAVEESVIQEMTADGLM